jgi:hypothetical protein
MKRSSSLSLFRLPILSFCRRALFRLPSSLLVLAFFLVLLSACHPDKHFPIEPYIEYGSFTKYADDSADLMIRFTDGDGDLGLNENDPQDFCFFANYYYFNSVTNLWEKDTSLAGALNFSFPRLDQPGKHKGLEGEIIVHLYAPLPAVDFKFEIYVVDRANHASNRIMTPVLNF